MRIKRIEIENFLCYYGKSSITFDYGPTIIIGQNNTGKSKLFDAFNWVLYDKAFKTTIEEWKRTSDWKEELVNNFAKSKIKIGDCITTEITLEFDDEESNSYLLSREYSIIKRSENNWDCPKQSETSLSKKEPISNNYQDYYNSDAEDQIRLLFPLDFHELK